jgi:outer membrane receptor protein involved in Fe transport
MKHRMQRNAAQRRLPRHCLLAATLAGGLAQAASEVTLTPIEIIGTTPLPGIGQPREQVPANVQTLGAEQLKSAGEPALPAAMQRALPSVNVNEIQGNPYQADLNYRGFTASPLLGVAQGLSVYLDGVRVNEGFGDVVNWDLIPRSAIAGLTVVPGSNPLYGLNTLGGALALRSKDGRDNPGGQIEASAGSFHRRTLAGEFGGSRDELSWFFAAEGMKEDGWRDFSSTRVGQLFGKLGWKDARTDLALSVMHANNDLVGNGLLPESMLARERESIFTHPDHTANRLFQLALTGSRWISDEDQLSATLYLRRTRSRTLNGDGDDDFEDSAFDGISNEGSGVINRTATDQNGSGAALQWTRYLGAHQLALGASHDRSHARFEQTSQEGRITANRGIAAEEDEELDNALIGYTRTTSVFLSDLVELSPSLHLTAAARFNHTHVINVDRLGDDLDGDFTYNKLNPALGLAWAAAPGLSVYGGFSQGNRAPTPIELGCADPDNPCTLPNALAADPFLKQVVARTFEFGVRGRAGGATRWNAGIYRTTNRDDILFVGTSRNAGYFTNFGKTRREGLELGISGQSGALAWRADYSYLWATFRSGACLLAENNSSAGADARCGDDEIRVSAGDRLPGLPRHSLKLGVDWRATDRLRLGADLAAYANQSVRGNENGKHRASDDFGGSGMLGGYAVVNVDGDFDLGRGWSLFGRVDNLFDKRYATGGALAENIFDAGGRFLVDSGEWSSEQFVAPGAPRAGWIGVRYRWGARS